MVSSDTVVGIVGAVILTGAMIAVFYYENSNADDGSVDIGTGSTVYTFGFNETADEATFDAQTVEAGTPWEQTVEIPPYTFAIHVEVTWVDDSSPPLPAGGSMDNLTVTIQNEAGADIPNGTQSAANGTLSIRHGHRDNETTPPETLRVAANSEDEANRTLQTNLSALHGAGNWTIIVTYNNGGTSPVAQVDTTGNFSVRVHYEYHRPERQQ